MHLKHLVLAASVAACSPQRIAPTSSAFTVAADSVTDFDATLHEGAAWARVVVRYTPETTYYELTSSHGPLALAGTEPSDDDTLANAIVADPRASDGFVLVKAGDPESGLLERLLDQLAATATPSLAEKGTTRYAAAYTVARVLGMLEQPTAGVEQLPTIWPYPGYDDLKMMPRELAPASVVWGVSCCGPNNCTICEMHDWGFACGDWCSAGDHCNAWHGGSGCGEKFRNCPHSDSAAITSAGGPNQYCDSHGW